MHRALMLLSLFVALPALAQLDLQTPGHVQLVDLQDPNREFVLGTDSLGYRYVWAVNSIACFKPDNPQTTRRISMPEVGPQMKQGLPALVSPLADRAFVLGLNDAFKTEYWLGQIRCETLQTTAKIDQLTTPDYTGPMTTPDNWKPNSWIIAPQGQIWLLSTVEKPNQLGSCVTALQELNPADSSLKTLGDSTTWDAELGLPALAQKQPVDVQVTVANQKMLPAAEGWAGLSLWMHPKTQRIFLLTTRQEVMVGQGSFGYQGAQWLLERQADGQMKARLRPAKIRLPTDSILNQVSKIRYDSTLDALLLGPIAHYEYSSEMVLVPGGDGGGNPVTAERGPGGDGWYVYDLASERAGYLSMRAALAATTSCTAAFACGQALWGIVEDAEGTIIQTKQVTEAKGSPTTVVSQYRRMKIDLDTLDMDEDGLTAAEEKALGTSDFRRDSDGGTVSDLHEHVWQTSPTDGKDDPVWDVVNPGALIHAASSPLIRKRLPAALHSGPLIRSYSPDAPLCGGGVCVDAAGRVTAHYPTGANISGQVVAADGQHVLFWNAQTLESIDLQTGQVQPVAEAATINAVLELPSGAPQREIIAVDGKSAFVLQKARPAQIAWLEACKPGKLLYDLHKNACDANFNSCLVATAPGEDDVMGTLENVGYERETGYAELRFQTFWHKFWIGVHPQKPLTLLDKVSLGNALAPRFLVPLTGGLYATPSQFVGPGFTPLPYAGDALAACGDTIPAAGLGGMLVQNCGGAYGPEPDLLFETVRVDPQVQPGDLFVFAVQQQSGEGAHLMRSTPRGGLSEVWDQPDPTFQKVTGMSIRGDLRLCLADNGAGMLREYVSSWPGNAPTVEVTRESKPDVLDCHFDADGHLWLLLTNPPRLELRKDDTGNFTADTSISLGTKPVQFYVDKAGALQVLDGADGLLKAKFVTLAGDEVTVPTTPSTLYWHGAPLPNLPGLPGIAARSQIVERPDGQLVVMTDGGPFVLDPRDASVSELGVMPIYGPGNAMAVVPGWTPQDPWTGGKVTPPVPAGQTAQPGQQPGEVAVPTMPTGGDPLPVKGGCQAEPQPTSLWQFMLTMLFLLLAIRRQRT